MLVIVLALVMFTGSFSIGLLPATIKASNRVMNLISILGAGLLVGVALIVIIPEGMITLNEALESQREAAKIDPVVESVLIQIGGFTKQQITRLHMPSEGEQSMISWYLGGSLIFGFIIMLLLDQGFTILKERWGKPHVHEHEDETESNLTLRERLINRQEWKYIQNSVHSSKGGWMRVVRCSSLQQNVPRMLSNDFTDQKLVDAMGNMYIRHDAPVVNEHEEHEEHEEHDDHDGSESHDHVHEHFHGDSSNLIISTIGLVVHSIADGVALGSTWYKFDIKYLSFIHCMW